MGFRRYVAPSAREALNKIRRELGPEAVILSNRRSDSSGSVEIIAAAPGQMRALVEEFEPAPRSAAAAPAPAPRPAEAQAKAAAPKRVPPESFQEFIRRQSAPRTDALAMYQSVADGAETAEEAGPSLPGPARRAGPASEPAVFRRRPSRLAAPAEAGPRLISAAAAGSQPALAGTAAPAAVPAVEAAPVAAPATVAAPAALAEPAAAAAAADPAVMLELQSLRSTLTDRISLLEKQIAPAQASAQTSVRAPAVREAEADARASKRQALARLVMSGFSPELARRISEELPADLDRKDAETWLQNSLARQIRCPVDADNALFSPGAVALVGPTGVGKTTTVAKLDARFVVRHGAAALGLVTLDSYRMGAHEQLRSYGRILGVPVQVAHDGASLRDLLRSMHGKRKVLIDTCGMSQRDPRLSETLAMLAEARFTELEVTRVLLINAASHAETLDEVAKAWRVAGAQGAILTKLDEAARIGGGLDALIRFQLPLMGLTNGQRVPEDWHPGNAALLAHIALKPFGAAFCMDGAEIRALTGAGAARV